MNSILELPAPNDESQASPDAPPQFDHRGNGKIARLPKLIRDQVNNWLLDGLTYPDIIQRLGEHGQDLKPDHISQWKKRAYQDWLRQREWLEHLTSKSEFSTDILAAPDSSALHEAGLRLAASQMFDQLMRFSASANAADSKGQPEQFSRLVNALSRLTREALAFQKYRAATAKENTRELKRLDPNRKSSEKERDVVLHLWRDFFGHDLTQPDNTETDGAVIPEKVGQCVPPVPPEKVGERVSPVPPETIAEAEVQPAPQRVGDKAEEKAAPKIKNQRSKIKNKGVSADNEKHTTLGENPEQAPFAIPATNNQNSKFAESCDPNRPAPLSTSEHVAPLPRPDAPRSDAPDAPAEHCLECNSPLPALRPDGGRPSKSCPICCFQLPPAGSCVERSIEKCPNCRANLPRVLPTGERTLDHCHHCGSSLPPPVPVEAQQRSP